MALQDDAGGSWTQRAMDAFSQSDLEPGLVHLAWELGELWSHDSGRIVWTALVLLEAVARGSTRVASTDVVVRAQELGAPTEVVQTLRDKPGGTPFVTEGGYIYLHRIWTLETRLVSQLGRQIAQRLNPLAQQHVRLSSTRRKLTPGQREAVDVALRQPFVIVRGGPGTGKTFVAQSILRAASAAGAAPGRFLLAAPTGKAADRLNRAIAQGLQEIDDPGESDHKLREQLRPASTLHRALGYSPRTGSFAHHADNPLDAELVLVDESSMVDVFLMYRLLDALPQGSRLVLLGDPDQLPSVAAGAVFRDLATSDEVATVELGQSHRMDPSKPEGRNILEVAQEVDAGRWPPEVAVQSTGARRLPSKAACVGRLEELADIETLGGVLRVSTISLSAFLNWWFHDVIFAWKDAKEPTTAVFGRRGNTMEETETLAAAFREMERARLLCITRRAGGRTSADEVNRAMHARYRRWQGVRLQRGTRFGPGEPVLIERNDYARSLFNGDQGLVLSTVEGVAPPRLSAVFRRENGFIAHPLDAIRDSVSHSYATTVHKAQGSEHDHVAIVLPERDNQLLTREILYTAITRARRSAIVIGSTDLAERAASRRIRRSSGIGRRLRELGAGHEPSGA